MHGEQEHTYEKKTYRYFQNLLVLILNSRKRFWSFPVFSLFIFNFPFHISQICTNENIPRPKLLSPKYMGIEIGLTQLIGQELSQLLGPHTDKNSTSCHSLVNPSHSPLSTTCPCPLWQQVTDLCCKPADILSVFYSEILRFCYFLFFGTQDHDVSLDFFKVTS